MSGMAIWVATINKVFGAERWSNVYRLQAANLTEALNAARNVVQAERAVTANYVNFTEFEVRPQIIGAGGGTVEAINENGQIAQTGEYLPLWNVVRVIFRPATGKPSMKYLKRPILESDQNNGILTTSLVQAYNTNYVAAMLAIAAFVDNDGQPFLSGTVYPQVQMRQQKRKRRTRAGLKRGWVPK